MWPHRNDGNAVYQEDIKSRLNSGNACNHVVRNLVPSCVTSKHVKITIYKNITLPVVSYGYQTLYLMLRKGNILMESENRVLGIFGTKYE
jgi:hypothetical protein